MGRAIYVIELSPDELSAVEFARGRYDWATELANHLDDEQGAAVMTEAEAWEWRDACESEDALFACAAPQFAEKLYLFMESIV